LAPRHLRKPIHPKFAYWPDQLQLDNLLARKIAALDTEVEALQKNTEALYGKINFAVLKQRLGVKKTLNSVDKVADQAVSALKNKV
jgi:hypothetical protein